jgi:gas vesicle protein
MAEFRLGKSEKRLNGYAGTLGMLALGLGVGAVAGLLTAPKSGKQLRRDVRRKVEDARDAVERAGERVGRRAGEFRERAEELAQAAKRKAEPVARMLRPA